MKIALSSLLLGIVVVLSATGTFISLVSYLQIRTRKVFAILLVFLIFLLKSSVMVISQLWHPILSDTADPLVLILDVIILAVLLLFSFME
ncbi:MAG: hypothetical protein R6W73_07980 [Candidatus Saliniplasma sp.]